MVEWKLLSLLIILVGRHKCNVISKLLMIMGHQLLVFITNSITIQKQASLNQSDQGHRWDKKFTSIFTTMNFLCSLHLQGRVGGLKNLTSDINFQANKIKLNNLQWYGEIKNGGWVDLNITMLQWCILKTFSNYWPLSSKNFDQQISLFYIFTLCM